MGTVEFLEIPNEPVRYLWPTSLNFEPEIDTIEHHPILHSESSAEEDRSTLLVSRVIFSKHEVTDPRMRSELCLDQARLTLVR